MLKNTGTITFNLRHEHEDWATNDNGYNFGTVSNNEIQASAVKNPDGTVEIAISGPFEQGFKFRRPVPPCDERGLHVAITWDKNEVKLYLNGQLEEQQRAITLAALTAAENTIPLSVPEYIGNTFGESRARAVVESPDNREEVSGDDFLLSIYSKNRSWGMDIVAVSVQPGNRFVASAFHVFNDVSDRPLQDLSLLSILRIVAERFGLNMSLGGDTRRFFINEKIPTRGISPADFVQINNGRNDDFQSNCLIKFTVDGFAHVGMAFCLNTTRYGEWVASHDLGGRSD